MSAFLVSIMEFNVSTFTILYIATGMSQKDFAKAVGVEPRTVRRWLAGESVPGKTKIAKVATVCDVDSTVFYLTDTDFSKQLADNSATKADILKIVEDKLLHEFFRSLNSSELADRRHALKVYESLKHYFENILLEDAAREVKDINAIVDMDLILKTRLAIENQENQENQEKENCDE